MSSKITASQVPLKAKIAPQSVAAAAHVNSGWVDAGQCINILTEVNLGALGGGSVALTFEQATSSGGAGAKALSTFTGAVSAVDNTTAEVDNAPEGLDADNGFQFVRAVLTVTGGSGSLVAATVHAASPRFI